MDIGIIKTDILITVIMKDGEILPSVEQQFSDPDRRNSPCSVPASCFPDLSDHGKDHGHGAGHLHYGNAVAEEVG